METQMNDFYTPKETAKLLGVHYITVYRWLNDGTLRGIRLGPKLWRVPRSEIERMSQAQPIVSNEA